MTSNPSSSRIQGLDLARGLAVVGMVLVNFVYVLSHDHVLLLEKDSSLLTTLSPENQVVVVGVLILLAGRAAAVFLVLFGIGVELQVKGGKTASALLPRYFLLILGGMAFIPLWEADILHFIGLFGIIAVLLTRLKPRFLPAIFLTILVIAEGWRLGGQYSHGWAVGQIGEHYEQMWSVPGQWRQLFFNGYHPVFPWMALVVWGMFLGTMDLENQGTAKKLLLYGLIASALGFLAQALGVPADFFPAHTLFILLGTANATWIIALSLMVRGKGLFHSLGRLALTHYPAHIVLGIVPVMIWRTDRMDLSFAGSFALATVYLLVTIPLGRLWLAHKKQGPLEKLIRVLSNFISRRWNRLRDGVSNIDSA